MPNLSTSSKSKNVLSLTYPELLKLTCRETYRENNQNHRWNQQTLTQQAVRILKLDEF